QSFRNIDYLIKPTTVGFTPSIPTRAIRNYALLVTAYYAEYEHRRRKLKKEHDGFWQKQEPPTW
ncbi:hypothetical protein, partial [Corynebacterium pyruviciproducens]|uniref:hypothetical protein n=1 Tax=Corynebacterium pyruviciproducens TaxID=598660 RepID=UPI00254D7EFB